MHALALLAMLLAAQPSSFASCWPALEANTEIRPVGAFTNMRFTEEHAYGYTLHLWRAGNCLFGLFFASAGLAGDTPVGLLENVTYRPVSAEIAFRARLTLGLFMSRKFRQPSREIYEFAGRLERDSVDGKLTRSNALTPQLQPVAEAISLRKEVNLDSMLRATTISEWRSRSEELLKGRRPKR